LLREFTDSQGNEWRVWDVNPVLHANPVHARKAFPRVPQGWLCFESAAERRRLSPIPEAWETCTESMLAEFCVAAELVKGILDEGQTTRESSA
jgi:hypothetical protein